MKSNFLPTDISGDRAHGAKWIIRTLAYQYGLTDNPQKLLWEAGSGLHVHTNSLRMDKT
ncbi:MAG: hypothetical protein R2764_10310 [Bacteroidales bacterium]